jgi:hypothetical protein
VDNSQVPQDLIGVPFFSAAANYNPGQPVNYQGQQYVALTSIAAGVWNPAQWTLVATQNWVLAQGTILPRFIAGLELSNDSTGPTYIGIEAGSACSDDYATMMAMTVAGFKKDCSATWVVGSGNGALDSAPLAASKWYHVFLILRPDTGIIDVYISQSLTPTLPPNYTKKRRIGSVLTDSLSHIVAFTQTGGHVAWKPPLLNYNGVSLGVGPAMLLISVPPGVKSMWRGVILLSISSGPVNMTVGPGDMGTTTQVNTPPGNEVYVADPSHPLSMEYEEQTDTAQRISFASGLNVSGPGFYVSTKGYFDFRGQ